MPMLSRPFPSCRLAFRLAVPVALAAASSIAAASAIPDQPPHAGAAAAPKFADPDNAALLYFKTWLQKGYIDLKQPCSDQLKGDQPQWRPDAALVNQLAEQQGIIAQLLRATRRPTVDFGLEYSQGIGLLLSHPAEMRATARILACDARRCLAGGDIDGACERVAAIHRLALHCTADRVLISSLVSIAINSVANHEMRAVLATGKMTGAGRQLILAESRLIAAPDGFGVKRSLDVESWLTSGWLRTFAAGPDAGARLAEQLTPLLDSPASKDLAARLPAMPAQQINAELDRMDGFYREVLAVWGTPQAEQSLAAITTRLERGEFGELAQALAPSLSRAHQADVKAQADHAAALRQLEQFIPLR